MILFNETFKKKYLKNKAAIFEKIKHIKKLHVTNFLNLLLNNKFTIDCIKTDDKWYEFDDYSDYLNYKKYFSVHKSSQLSY